MPRRKPMSQILREMIHNLHIHEKGLLSLTKILHYLKASQIWPQIFTDTWAYSVSTFLISLIKAISCHLRKQKSRKGIIALENVCEIQVILELAWYTSYILGSCFPNYVVLHVPQTPVCLKIMPLQLQYLIPFKYSYSVKKKKKKILPSDAEIPCSTGK